MFDLSKYTIILRLCILCAAMLFFTTEAIAQPLTPTEQDSLSAVIGRIVEREIKGCRPIVRSVEVRKGALRINTSIGLSYYPFRESNTKALYDSVRNLLPAKYRKGRVEIFTDGNRIEEFIPLVYRAKPKGYKRFTNPSQRPLVEPLSRAYHPSEGLTGRHIALWQSHGRYFNQSEAVWKWQRSRLWQTCEDLFTQSFVLPYLVPMLERAGANVLLPRERDFNHHEIIADNDGGGIYSEHNGTHSWQSDTTGFAHKRQFYLDGENPFREGSSRKIKCASPKEQPSHAVWGADIPERGEYAIYVSYQSYSASADDAVYAVRHLGGESRYRVNQRMGGGTWIYLGHFMLPEGRCDSIVMLSNRSARKGGTISADAIKIGGGMGNIARVPCDSLRIPGVEYEPMTSQMPRWCEGARYWLQWAGFPESVYTPQESKNDYKDDYQSRAHWVNALMGGSERLPDSVGLAIPIDMALAFHTDAGVTTEDNATIGTLGIFFTGDNRGRFMGGSSRYVSRDLTDLVMTQLSNDIEAKYDSLWRRRGMWNRSYYEARVPCVPTMLLELLSHHNFADMRYGADPRFRFTASRAIYKAILRHLSTQYGTPYRVAPLPPESFSAELCGGDSVLLRWCGVRDELEPTADPEQYILYTRSGDGAFDNGRIIEGEMCVVRQREGEIYSYRVAALNKGGESFPSETLSVCKVAEERGRVMIINGFNRVSAPLTIREEGREGFLCDEDSGVDFIRDVAYIGRQRIYDPSLRKSRDHNEALGASYSDYEGRIAGGNTFDYPALHGRAIAAAGYSFASTSAQAVEEGWVTLNGYGAVDLILGKQRTVSLGCGQSGYEFHALPRALQQALRSYSTSGGGIFLSGSYIATDPWHGAESNDADRAFVREVLHYEYGGNAATRSGRATAAPSLAKIKGNVRFNQEVCEKHYTVNSPDVLRPTNGSYPIMRYAENGRTAGVAWSGDYRTLALGFPFESIIDHAEREQLMSSIMEFLFRQGGTDYMR